MCSICKITCKKGDTCFCLMCPYMPNDEVCRICGQDSCNSQSCALQIHLAFVGYCYLCFEKKKLKLPYNVLCAFHKSLETPDLFRA
jgi:hypothetical protein